MLRLFDLLQLGKQPIQQKLASRIVQRIKSLHGDRQERFLIRAEIVFGGELIQ